MPRAPAERDIIGVERRGQVVHPGTYIGDLHDRISAELPLEPEVPLLDVRILAISGGIDHVYATGIVDIDIVYGGRRSTGPEQQVVVPLRPLTDQADRKAGWICGRGRAVRAQGNNVKFRVLH